MEQNKTVSPAEASAKAGKYLKYAIGEIVLVVIGILIAISINTAVNNTIDHKKEIKYLQSLNNDILNIESGLKTTELSLLNIGMACDSLINSIHKPNSFINPDKLNSLTSIMISIPSADISFQSYNNLKNTSDLSLIKNDALKLSLSDVELALSRLEISREWQDKQWTNINQIYINKKMDLLDLSANDKDEYRANVASIFKNNWEVILKDSEFSNIIVNRKWAVLDMLKAQNKLKKTLKNCKQLIKGALEKQ